MGLLDRFRKQANKAGLSGAFAIAVFSSGCETPEGTWAAGGIAGANSLYNTSLSPQASAGLGLASLALQSGAIIQQGQNTQEMIRRQQNQASGQNRKTLMGLSIQEALLNYPSLNFRQTKLGDVVMVMYKKSEDRGHDGKEDFPEDYVGLLPRTNLRVPYGEEYKIDLQTEKEFLQIRVVILDNKENTISDSGFNSEKPINFSCVKLQPYPAGKYNVLFYARPYVLWPAIVTFKGERPPPPAPVTLPAEIFVTSFEFEIYDGLQK